MDKLKILKEKIELLDWILVGTLLKQYKQCLKPNCKCMEKRKYWHGPYYVWTRKENGKTITKTLNEKQIIFFKKALRNKNLLNQYFELWKKYSLKKINELL